MIGHKFGRLTITALSHKKKGVKYWTCLCDCGNSSSVSIHALEKGHTKSCGCLAREVRRNKMLTHGCFYTPTYKIWAAMKGRCTNPRNRQWGDYGGRGITVCERWLKFENFLTDMGERPDELEIERINNNEGYNPANCRWATIKDQSRNKRNSTFLTYQGLTLHMSEWAEKIGMNMNTIRTRHGRGWSDDKILSQPLKKYSRGPT